MSGTFDLFSPVYRQDISQTEKIAEIAAPTASGEGGQGLIDAVSDVEAADESAREGAMASPDRLSVEIMTFSLVPKRRWLGSQDEGLSDTLN